MTRSVRLLVTSALGFTALGSLASAQSTAPRLNSSGTTPATSPVFAPAPAEKAPPPAAPTTTPKRTRAISPEVAAALAAATPKIAPAPPKPEPKPEAEQVDLRDVDKPKNQIIRLPKYIVQEQKPPVFRERDIHTEKGLTDIAMRRYITDADRALNRWTLPLFGSSMQARAMAMYAEEERLKNMADLRDAAVDTSRVDPAAGDYIRREAQKTYLRSADFGWSSGEPR